MDKKSTFEKLLISKTFHRIFLSLVLNYPLRKIFLIYGNISLFVYAAGIGVLAGGFIHYKCKFSKWAVMQNFDYNFRN